MARRLCAVLMGAALLSLASGARAATMPTISLHPDNVGIGTFTITDFTGTTIQITETWISTDPGIYLVTGLDDGVTYTFERNIDNQSAADWTEFGIELFDPPGQEADMSDADADDYAALGRDFPGDICAPSCTPGSQDGLSMGLPPGMGGVDIFSSAFESFFYEEVFGPLQGKILDFFDGTAPNASSFFIRHGLVDFNADMSFPDQDSENQPFALFARVEGIDVNEATPLLLLTVTFGGLLLSSRGGGGPRPAI